MRISGGPNWQGWLVIAFVIYWAINGTLAPLLWFMAIVAVLVPLSIWLTRWNEREDRKLADEFPLDRRIQEKYGRKVDKTE